MPFLIDGHNVIAALPDIDLQEDHDEAKLVLKLRAWTARERKHATVVFDGGIPGGQSRTLSTSDVEVVFAARRRTNADRIIRARVQSLPDAPNWTVVSSDHEILDEARQTGARTVTAQDFAYALNNPPKEEKEKPQTVSPAELETWLEIFRMSEESEDVSAEDVSGENTDSSSPEKRASESADETEERQVPVEGGRTTASATRSESRKRSASGRGASQRGAKRRPSKRPRTPPAKRSARSIGEQLGMDEAPSGAAAKRPRRPEPETGKPSRVSDREVEEWLEVFEEPTESHVPPPPKIRRQRKPKKKAEPTVNKEGELSEQEVDAWLDVFGAEESEEPQVAKRPRRVEHRHMSKRLADHKERIEQPEDDEPILSEDDLDLWHSLFGDEDG